MKLPAWLFGALTFLILVKTLGCHAQTEEGLRQMRLQAQANAKLTTDRYPNHDSIFGKVKCLWCGDLLGSAPEQKAKLYPDEWSFYFVAKFKLRPKTRLILQGVYPHARYFSYTVANELPGGQLGNGPFLKAQDIVPDEGSLNPYTQGQSRDVMPRNYTIFLQWKDEDWGNASNASNTIRLENPDGPLGNRTLHFTLRVYLVDEGRDGTGVAWMDCRNSGSLNCEEQVATAIPTVMLQLGNLTVLQGPQLLKELNVQKIADPDGYSRKQWLSLISQSDDPTNAPCIKEPYTQRFWNIDYSVTGGFLATEPEERVSLHPAADDGGFANNPNTYYLLTPFSLAFKDLLVVQALKPSHPMTAGPEHSNDTWHQSDYDLQYFSVSVGGAPPSGEGWTSVQDEMIPVDRGGVFTVVVGWPWNRPSTATLEHKVVWLNAAAGEGHYIGSRIWAGVLYFRYMNTNADWAQSPANVPMPTKANPIPAEPRIMGPYYPLPRYMSRQEFERQYDRLISQ